MPWNAGSPVPRRVAHDQVHVLRRRAALHAGRCPGRTLTLPLARNSTPRGAVVAMLLVSTAAVACYQLLPSGQMVSWAVLGLASVSSVAYGVARHRPRPALPWILLGCSLLLEAVGDLTYQGLGGSVGGNGPFPSAADAVYLSDYPFAILALLGFVRRDVPEYRRGNLLDVLIVTVGLGALTWSLFVVPYTSLTQQSGLAKALVIVYLLGDTLVLALTLQLPLSGRFSSARCACS